MVRIALGLAVGCAAAGAPPLAAQEWNAPGVSVLVARAAEGRAAVLGPAGLRAYRAEARGLVLFLQQPDLGRSSPPRLAKADELDVEVYWRAPGRSKQVIRAWRDTTLVPVDMRYHRDHLGIVLNDFGDQIRLGDGDEVRDLPHPLALAGPAVYDYAPGRVLTVRSTDGELRVREVMVRPRDPGAPGVVGTLFLDEGTAALVRFRFTFTPAAYRDPTVEDIAVELENARVEGHWLPWRQSIEIRRQQAWLDLSVRGVIRATWEIHGHVLEAGGPLPPGPEVGGLEAPGGSAEWPEPLAMRLADLSPADAEALAAARAHAERVIAGRLLSGLPAVRLSFGGLSDLVRVNRVQGLTLGFGMRLELAARRFMLRPSVQLATADARVTGGLLAAFAHPRNATTLTAEASRRIRDLSDEPIVSPAVRSLLAQEGGRDYADWLLLDRVAIGAEHEGGPRWRFRAEAALERSVTLESISAPARGEVRPNPPLGSGTWRVVRVSAAHAEPASGSGVGGQLAVEGGDAGDGYLRMQATARLRARLGVTEMRVAAEGGQGTRHLPASRSFAIGGWGTLPGEPFRAWGGRGVLLLRSEWLVPVPGPGIPVGRLGRVGGGLHVGPFVAVGAAWDAMEGLPWQGSRGARPVAGAVGELLGGLVRVEAGWALRDGEFGLVIDAGRPWWGLL